MIEICPYCGNPLTYEDQCRTCKSEVSWAKKCYLKSDYYYIQAYDAAQARKLTVAEDLLKKAIYFNKYNIQARNLLGLIYYEIGEIGLALKAWILSVSLEKENNIASEYIEKIQNEPKLLEVYKESAQLYNKALKYLKEGNEDVATIRLKKAININPKLVEGKTLLALCYIRSNQFRKAKEQLEEVLKIDHNHLKAMEYLNAIRHKSSEEIQPYELEYTPKQNANKTSVLSRNSLFLRYTLYFFMGVLCMWVVEQQLVNPSKIQDYKSQITSLKNEKEALNKSIDTLKQENEEKLSNLQAENKKLQADHAVYEEAMTKKEQQDKLTQSETLISQGDYEGAAGLLYNVNATYLAEEEKANYEMLKQSAYEYAVNSLCNKGYNALQSEAFSEAKLSLETALLYEPNEYNKRRILYYLGQSEYGLGNNEKAISYFNEVIQNYPYTSEASWSESCLDEMNTQS